MKDIGKDIALYLKSQVAKCFALSRGARKADYLNPPASSSATCNHHNQASQKSVKFRERSEGLPSPTASGTSWTLSMSREQQHQHQGQELARDRAATCGGPAAAGRQGGGHCDCDTFVSFYLYLWHVTDADMCLPLYFVYFMAFLCSYPLPSRAPLSVWFWVLGLPSATPFCLLPGRLRSLENRRGLSLKIGYVPFKLVSNNFRLDVHKST